MSDEARASGYVRHHLQDVANQEFKTLDLSKMQYPTDRVTILLLRKLQPELFDLSFGNHQPKYFLQETPSNPAADAGIGSVMFTERMVALCAYAKAKGLPGPEGWGDDMDYYKPELVEFYCQHGLASGEHQAAELIRDIERQAAELGAQASSHNWATGEDEKIPPAVQKAIKKYSEAYAIVSSSIAQEGLVTFDADAHRRKMHAVDEANSALQSECTQASFPYDRAVEIAKYQREKQP